MSQIDFCFQLQMKEVVKTITIHLKIKQFFTEKQKSISYSLDLFFLANLGTLQKLRDVLRISSAVMIKILKGDESVSLSVSSILFLSNDCKP